jgi:hypothetical protein
MSEFQWAKLRVWREGVALVGLIVLFSAAAQADDSAGKSATEPGRVDFDYADGPQAAVEFELGPGMAGDLFGICDAAVAGVADALAKSTGTQQGNDGTKFAAEQVKAAEQIVGTLKEVVHGVRFRAYKGQGDQSSDLEKLITHYNDKLTAGNWETILRAHEGRQGVTVSAVRGEGGIKGIFVTATDHQNAVLVNVVCDVSPDNVKRLTTIATESGLRGGLSQVLQAKLAKMHAASQPGGKPADGQ